MGSMTQVIQVDSKIIKDDFDGLNNLVKALSNNKVVKVGILGNKTNRQEGKLTNAFIGAVNEFGSVSNNIPPRSFLRMPIHRGSEVIIKEAKKGSESLVKDGNMIQVLKSIGVSCIKEIQNAFATRGFGRWPKNAEITKLRKKSSSPLIDTSQLRKSITFKVGAPA